MWSDMLVHYIVEGVLLVGVGSQFYQFNYGVKERRAVRDRMFR